VAYVALAIFAGTTLYRVIKVANTPAHLRWELYPVPHEGRKKAKYGGSYLEETDWWDNRTKGSKLTELMVMIPEILLLKGVWEANRPLWFWSWSFHVGLYISIGMTVLVIAIALLGAESALASPLGAIARFMALGAFALGTLGCLGMLIKRATSPKLKPFTPMGTWVNLLFILAIFVTGLLAWFASGGTGYVDQLGQFIAGLVGLGAVATITPVMATHIIVTLVFMAYLPFTHMAHFVLKYFTWHSVRWNDEPNIQGSDLEKSINKMLTYKPTWAAAHWNTDGKKNWVDIATEEISSDEK